MSFLDLLRRHHESDARKTLATESPVEPANEPPGVVAPTPESGRAPSAPSPDADEASNYDKVQWNRKLQRILAGLPDTAIEFSPLMTEGHALGLADSWIATRFAEAFTLMIRGVVADHVLSETDLAKIDQARALMGLSESDAHTIVESVVADAQKFFQGPDVTPAS